MNKKSSKLERSQRSHARLMRLHENLSKNPFDKHSHLYDYHERVYSEQSIRKCILTKSQKASIYEDCK